MNRIGYDKIKTQYLVDGFRNGFRLNQVGELGIEEPEVDQSIKDNMQAARQKIEKEVESGRMMGPYDQPPLADFHLSPIKMREMMRTRRKGSQVGTPTLHMLRVLAGPRLT